MHVKYKQIMSNPPFYWLETNFHCFNMPILTAASL